MNIYYRHAVVATITALMMLFFWQSRMVRDPEMRFWRAVGDSSFLLLFYYGDRPFGKAMADFFPLDSMAPRSGNMVWANGFFAHISRLGRMGPVGCMAFFGIRIYSRIELPGSFGQVPTNPNWFRFPFLFLSLTVPILQSAAFIKSVRDRTRLRQRAKSKHSRKLARSG